MATTDMKQSVGVTITHHYERHKPGRDEWWSSVAAVLTEAEIAVLRHAVLSALSLAPHSTDVPVLQKLHGLLTGEDILRPIESDEPNTGA